MNTQRESIVVLRRATRNAMAIVSHTEANWKSCPTSSDSFSMRSSSSPVTAYISRSDTGCQRTFGGLGSIEIPTSPEANRKRHQNIAIMAPIVIDFHEGHLALWCFRHHRASKAKRNSVFILRQQIPNCPYPVCDGSCPQSVLLTTRIRFSPDSQQAGTQPPQQRARQGDFDEADLVAVQRQQRDGKKPDGK